MNYFEMKVVAMLDETEFVEVKGTTKLVTKEDIHAEYIPSFWMLIPHSYEIVVYTDWTADDILRHKFKTTL